VEINRQAMPDINIDYFGLMPHFTGRGYGGYFLNWAVDQAWSHEPKRLTVASCSLDDPRGLRTYQKAGFVPYQQTRKTIIDPRALGLISAHLQPRRV
jgi:GNAT superfamily N-acetyltransferase